MGATRHSIVIDASIKPRLEDMSKIVSQLQNGLKEGTTKIDMTKGVGKDLSKLFSKFETEMSKFKSITINDILKIDDASDFKKSGETIIKTFKDIQRISGDLGTKELIDAKKLFPSAFDDRVGNLLSLIGEVGKSFGKIAEKQAGLVKLNNEIETLDAEVTNLSASIENLGKLEAEVKVSNEEVNKALDSVEQLKKSLAEDAKVELGKIDKKTIEQQYQDALKEVNKFGDKFQRKGKGVYGTYEGKGLKNLKQGSQEYIQLQAYNNKLAALKEVEKRLERIQALENVANGEGLSDKGGLTKAGKLLDQVQQVEEALKRQSEAQDKAAAAEQRFADAQAAPAKLLEAKAKIEEKTKKVKELEAAITALNTKADFSTLSKSFKELNIDITPEMLQSAEGVQNLRAQLEAIDDSAYEELKQTLKEFGLQLPQTTNAVEDLEDGLRDSNEVVDDFTRKASEVEHLKNSFLQFFSLTNTVYLFKRAVQSAINTIKELDAVMTETAVVTDFTIGDMWEKLPQYSKAASGLGASIKDLYSATTLYYQQGLETEAAMGVGIETMKMARIANMEASDATTAMTAALRGFNMEVNEMNAQRVNDVYSELAAITAADTNQIATAMGKTASIAASANMEFETTSALLAQIIETTQEAPETAGTAMKTIIARFTEVKKLFSEGMLTGEDEEGEEIHINKIDAALRSVGISLKDFLSGSKGIDDIFLELASKWDTLDLATQRYIATTAAGSRQQSRFIAMMSNYERTMELVGAANNSAGASQEQFDKTLESLEAKLQQLNNAWQEFTMGLANNELVKGGVDLLTWLLETVNKLTEGLSGGAGLSKSIITLMTVLGALKGGKTMLGEKGLLGWIGGEMGIKSKGQKDSSSSSEQGKNDAKTYANGFQRAIATTKADGFKKGFKNLFFEQTDIDLVTRKNKKLFEQSIAQQFKDQKIEPKPDRPTRYDYETYRKMREKDLEPQIQKVQTIYKTEGFEAAQEYAKTYGITLEDTQAKSKALAVDLQAMGMAAMAAGTGFNMLAGVLEKNGSEEAAAGFRAVGTVLTTVGGLASTLGSIFPQLGAKIASSGVVAQLGWGWISVILIGITALIAGIAIAQKAAYNKSAEGKLEAAKKATEEASKAADEAKEAYDGLKSSLDSLKSAQATIDGLTKGTREWRDAIRESNDQVLDMITKYPELSAFLESDENGQLKFTEEKVNGQTVEEILSGYEQRETLAATSEVVAQKNQAVGELEVKLNGKDGIVDALKESIAGRKLGDTADSVQAKEQSYKNAFGDGKMEEILNALVARYEEGDAEAAKLLSGNVKSEDSAEYKDYLMGLGVAESQIGNFVNAVSENASSIRTYADTVKATNAQLEGYNQAIETLTESMLSDSLTEEQRAYAETYITDELINKKAEEKSQELLAGLEMPGGKEGDIIDKWIKYHFPDQAAYRGTGQGENGTTIYYSAVDDDGVGITQKSMNIDEYKDVLAQEMGQIYAVEEAEKVAETISLSSNETLKKLFSEENGLGLTIEDVENLSKSETVWNDDDLPVRVISGLKDFWDELSEEEKNIFGSYTDYLNFINEQLASAQQTQEKTNTNFQAAGFDSIPKEFAQLTVGALENLSGELVRATAMGHGDEAKSVVELLEGFDNLSADQLADVVEQVGLLDWSNLDQVEDLSEILEDLDVGLTIDQIEELERAIIQAGDATRNWNLDTFKKKFGELKDLVEDLEGREEHERIMTDAQRQTLLDQGVATRDQFVLQGEDEWVYIGDSLQGLIVALNANTSALVGSYDIVQRGEKSKVLQEEKIGSMTAGQYLEALLNQEDVTKGLAGENNGEDSLSALLRYLGIDEMSLNGDNNLIKAALQEAFNTYWGEGGAIANTNIVGAKEYTDNAAVLEYTSMGSGQDILSSGYEKTTSVVSGMLNDNGEWEYSTIDTYTGPTEEQQENQTKAIDSKLATGEGLSAQWNAYQEGVAGVNEELAENESLMKASIIDSDKYEKNLNALVDTFKDNKDILKQTNKETKEYQEALGKVTMAAKDAFGDTVTQEFVEANLGLFEEWAEGVEGSGEKIQEALKDSYIDAMQSTSQITAEEAAAIDSAFTALDGQSFDIYGNADASQVFTELAAVMGSAEEAAAAIEAMGYSVNWIPNGYTDMKMPDGTTRRVPNYKTVVNNATKNVEGSNRAKGGGGGGGGGGVWENPYDKLYNLQQEINEELRERERIERRYDKLLEKREATIGALVDLSNENLKQLEEEARLQQNLISGREQQMQQELDKNPELAKYFTLTENEAGEWIINIDWEEIDKITDEEEGQKLEDALSNIEDWVKDINDANETLNDIEDTVQDIYERGKDEYFDFESQVKDALINSYQKQIDSLSDINDSINDTNDKLLESIQNSIDKIRQDRENEKTEQDLADKQRQLSYLQLDSSGANELEILRLQKELEEGQKDYTDTLIDQKINELQQQNDIAAEQRERQIEIAQAQLDHWVDSGQVWQQVYDLMDKGIDSDGILSGSRLEEVLKSDAGFEAMSVLDKMEWLSDLETNVAQAVSYLKVGRQLEALGTKEGSTITFKTSDGKELTGTTDKYGNVKVGSKYYEGVYQNWDGTFMTDEKESDGKTTISQTASSSDNFSVPVGADKPDESSGGTGPGGYLPPKSYEVTYKSSWTGITYTKTGSTEAVALGNIKYQLGQYLNKYPSVSTKDFWDTYNDDINNHRYTVIPKYKTGGLADFTGPAWLDGTKSRPEYVLNSDQTRAFFTLVDVLESFKAGSTKSSENSGDNTYDIDINVESIGNDYDVEQLAEKIKSLINEDARYRNNNTISRTR